MRPRSPYPPPLTAPPSWLPLLESGDGGPGAATAEDSAAPASGGNFPGEGWPSIETIEYVSKFIVLVVLLLALPAVVSKLLSGHTPHVSMGPPSMGA
jgi:hypothetical protein